MTAGVVVRPAGADNNGVIRHVAEFAGASQYRNPIDHRPVACRVVIEVSGKPPACAGGIQCPDRFDGFPPKAARPDHDEAPPSRGRHGTETLIVGLKAADVTTDTTCSCCDSVMSWNSGRISECLVSRSV